MNTDIDNLKNMSPKDIAIRIFTNEPQKPYTYQIIASDTQDDITFIFEIGLVILLEGFNILIGDLNNADLTNFSISHIKNLNPWFNSLGFDINVSEHNVNDKDSLNKYYCNILINRENTKYIFEKNNIKRNYHFFINELYFKNHSFNKLSDIYAIFFINNAFFKISFDFTKHV
jgi:hypothetical protein